MAVCSSLMGECWGVAPCRGVPAVRKPRHTDVKVSPWMACAATAAAAALPFSCAAAVSSAATRISRGPGSPCAHSAVSGMTGLIWISLVCRTEPLGATGLKLEVCSS